MARLGFWADLSKVQFSEAATSSWVHALSVGKFSHPMYGDIEITPERVTRFTANIKAKARGIDPSINYDHINMGEAAGWVTDADSKPDGLWLLVEWTEPAREKIRKRLYRYFSSEFDDEWEDPKTHTRFQDVLYGGALTNRPFLKDLVPVNLSELTGDNADSANQEKEGEGMDPKVLRQMLGLAETATDDDVTAKIKALAEPPTPPVVPVTPPPQEVDVNKLLSELVDVGNSPAVTQLKEIISAQQTRLAEMDRQLYEQRIDRKLAELEKAAEEHNVAIPPVTLENIKKALMESPKQLGEMLFDAYKKTIEMGIVELGERGWQRKMSGMSPEQRFNELVADVQNKNTALSYADAVELVSRDNPQLFEEYRVAATAWRE